MQYPNFIDGSNELDSTVADYQRTVNMMPEVAGQGAKNQVILRWTPGLDALATVASTNAVRGMFLGDQASTQYFYCAIDDVLYKFKTDGTYETVGAITDDSTHTCIKTATGGTNSDTLIVASGTAYSLVSGVLSTITALEGSTCVGASYINGYWVTAVGSTFKRSAVGDITSWDALDYDYADTQPETIVGHVALQSQLWLFGGTKTNIWYVDDSNDFGFSPLTHIQIQRGAISGDAIQILDNAVCWVGNFGIGGAQVLMARSYAPNRISTHYVEKVFDANFTQLSNCYSYTMEEGGHEVMVISIPNAETSLCYDAATQRWHERAYWDGTSYALHLGKCHMVKNGVHYVGARNSGTIYIMDKGYYDDDGTSIKRMRRAPHLAQEGKRIFYKSFELDIDKCLGADATTPTMYMRYSNDGGKSWQTALSANMGETDDSTSSIRCKWNRLGQSRDRVFEVYSTASIAHVWTDAFLEVQ